MAMDEETKKRLQKLVIAALEEAKAEQEEELEKLWDASVRHHKGQGEA